MVDQLKDQIANKPERIYIAGPMSNLPDFNRPAFRTAAEILREQGFEVVNPGEFPQSDSWDDMMRHAIPEMLSCDRVVLLGLWETSRGARLEAFIARELGMKVEMLAETILSLPTKPLEQVRREAREKHTDLYSKLTN